MKLTARIILLVFVAIVGLLAIDGYLSLQREVEFFESDMKRDAQQLGDSLAPMIERVWKSEGEAAAMEMIRLAGAGEKVVRIRWVWFDANPGDPFAPMASEVARDQLQPSETAMVIDRADDGQSYLCTYVFPSIPDDRLGAIELSESLAAASRFKSTTITRIAVLTGVLLLVSLMTVVFVGVRMIGNPLTSLIEKTRRIGDGDLSDPINLVQRDELGELGHALNLMCERLATARDDLLRETQDRINAIDQLRHADRLTTIGRLAAGVAHELGTPLNVVLGRAGLISSAKLSKEEVTENAEIIRSQIDRMTKIIRQLLDFARQRQPKRARADISILVRQSVELLTSMAKKNQVILTLNEPSDPIYLQMDEAQIQQVVTNLIVNAIQAMPSGGRADVTIQRSYETPPHGVSSSAGEFVEISVRDEGIGIAESDLPKLFDPFFTTKDVGEGTGLGLSISHGIIQEHGGWIDVQSIVGEGSCFSLYIPVEDQ